VSEIQKEEAVRVATESLVNAEVHVDVLESIIASVKKIIWKIWEAIKNVFNSIFRFFQSKIMKTDQNILKDNRACLEAYYRSSVIVKANLTCYKVQDAGKEYLSDYAQLRDAVPKICSHIDNMISSIENPSGFLDKVKYTTGLNEDDSGIKKIKKELFARIVGSSRDPDMLTDDNINHLIRKKYFLDTRKSDEQEIKRVFPDIKVFDEILSDSAYTAVKRMYDESKKTINNSIQSINKFELHISKASGSTIRYATIDSRMKQHRNLLTTLLYTTIAFWDLYITVRRDCIRAGKSIILFYKEK
jgi:hypothetical protein